MENGRPNGYPGHKLWIQCSIIPLYNVKYSVIKQRYKPSDADDGEWLSTESAEDHACESGGKESFVDTVEAACAAVHV
jgi:hypothetical protein